MKERTLEELTKAGFKLITFNPPLYAKQENEMVEIYERNAIYVRKFFGKKQYLPPEIKVLLGEKE